MARKAKDESATDDGGGRIAQVRAVWSLARKSDPKLALRVFLPALAVIAVLVVVGVLIGHVVYLSILAVVGGLLVGTSIFGRRATSSMYAQVEGQPGAAASVLQTLRGDWRVTPAVGMTRNMDFVHRVVGRPGIVLIGEGAPAQLRQLIVDQKKKIGRVAPDTPIHDFVVGDDEGQVPLRKLQREVMKLPRVLKGGEIGAVEQRMRAIGGTAMPLPKGPMPKAGRVPRGKMR
jgi:xanthosine utilization system XapX-like protein